MMNPNEGVANQFASYTRIIVEISEFPEEGGQPAVDALLRLRDDHPRLPSLVVESFTIGTMFFDPDRYAHGEVYKLVLANSFLRHINIHLRVLAEFFVQWQDVAFPGRQLHLAGRHHQNPHIDVYHKEGKFVVDCLFIIEVIRRFTRGRYQNNAVDELGSIGLLLQARRDLMVNDNQIPFCILRSLFNLAFPDDAQTEQFNFVTLSLMFFSQCLLVTEISQVRNTINNLRQQIDNQPEIIKDFIDLARKCHAPIFERQHPEDPIQFKAMRKATYLQEAGMSISPAPMTITVCSLRYRRGKLEIPKLRITQKSIHLLRNLMEYEIRHYPQDTFIIDYLYFMCSLIDTANDVDILIHKGILDNFLPTSEGVANLFNSIVQEAPLISHNYYYHGISAGVNAYCQIRRHRWRATLRRDYFSTPWMTVATIASISLVVLAFIQTTTSVIRHNA